MDCLGKYSWDLPEDEWAKCRKNYAVNVSYIISVIVVFILILVIITSGFSWMGGILTLLIGGGLIGLYLWYTPISAETKAHLEWNNDQREVKYYVDKGMSVENARAEYIKEKKEELAHEMTRGVAIRNMQPVNRSITVGNVVDSFLFR